MIGALKAINELKELGIIQDYSIGGAYAVGFYLEPILTFDLDIFVLMDSDDEFHRLYSYFRERQLKIENIYVIIDELPVQFLPTYIGPLFREAVLAARRVEMEGVETKVLGPEHLVACLLLAYRPKDKAIIPRLLELSDMEKLMEIVERFDDEKAPLLERLRGILAGLQ